MADRAGQHDAVQRIDRKTAAGGFFGLRKRLDDRRAQEIDCIALVRRYALEVFFCLFVHGELPVDSISSSLKKPSTRRQNKGTGRGERNVTHDVFGVRPILLGLSPERGERLVAPGGSHGLACDIAMPSPIGAIASTEHETIVVFDFIAARLTT